MGGTKAFEKALEDGERPLSTAIALSCLEAGLCCAQQVNPSAVQLCVSDVDWGTSVWRELPVTDLVHRRKLEPRHTRTGAKSSINSGDSPSQKVEAFLVKNTKGSSSWKKIKEKSLHQLGLDSLEIVQLRNSFNKNFGVNVPLSQVADPNQTLTTLSGILAKNLQL